MVAAGYTALTGIEQPQAPSAKLRRFSYISNFQSTGDIPAFLGGLASLEKLDMSTNNFNGTIPGEALCGTLICVCGFGFQGPRGSCAGFLPRAAHSASGVIVVFEMVCFNAGSLGNLTSLRQLLLCCNGLSGTAPASLAASPVLETLELYENGLVGSVPASIGSSTTLRSARLSVNNFSGSLPPFAGE